MSTARPKYRVFKWKTFEQNMRPMKIYFMDDTHWTSTKENATALSRRQVSVLAARLPDIHWDAVEPEKECAL